VDVDATASGAGVLTTHLDTPVVTKTTVGTNLLHALEVVTEGGVNVVGRQVHVLASLVVALPVKHVCGDLELKGVLDDSNKTLDLIGGEFTSTLGGVYLSLLAADVGETTADTLDGGERETNFSATINIGIEDTQDVLEVGVHHERLRIHITTYR